MRKVNGSADTLARPTDEELLTRYRDEGRPQDFDELVRRYERELYRYLVRYLGNAAMAEDVFQNTFLQVYQKNELYEDGRPVRPWLYAIATRQAIDEMRKQGRRKAVSLDRQTPGNGGESDVGSLVDLLVSDSPGPLTRLQGDERAAWVRESISRLPDALRETLVMAYFQDLKYREIAEAQGIPVGTVKSRLHAAIAKLQEMARGTGHEASE
jgi:RNA polymerase sigma-70 factor (ECF subfamily)